MKLTFRRRDFGIAAATLAVSSAEAQTVPAVLPSHPIEVAREVVLTSHGNFKRLKELVDERPALARAAVDWGFGDWEDALGAASHVGNREIAEYLIAKGARPSIFSAAMLGQLEVVKAFVTAQPGIQRIPGPHSIGLLEHAKAGGKAAQPLSDYLLALGDAGSEKPAALATDEAASFAGKYTYGAAPNEQIEIAYKNGQLLFTRQGTPGRNLFYVGDNAFRPAGAREVRVRFATESLTIHDGSLVVTAKKL